jgi:hypothetical protein
MNQNDELTELRRQADELRADLERLGNDPDPGTVRKLVRVITPRAAGLFARCAVVTIAGDEVEGGTATFDDTGDEVLVAFLHDLVPAAGAIRVAKRVSNRWVFVNNDPTGAGGNCDGIINVSLWNECNLPPLGSGGLAIPTGCDVTLDGEPFGEIFTPANPTTQLAIHLPGDYVVTARDRPGLLFTQGMTRELDLDADEACQFQQVDFYYQPDPDYTGAFFFLTIGGCNGSAASFVKVTCNETGQVTAPAPGDDPTFFFVQVPLPGLGTWTFTAESTLNPPRFQPATLTLVETRCVSNGGSSQAIALTPAAWAVCIEPGGGSNPLSRTWEAFDSMTGQTLTCTWVGSNTWQGLGSGLIPGCRPPFAINDCPAAMAALEIQITGPTIGWGVGWGEIIVACPSPFFLCPCPGGSTISSLRPASLSVNGGLNDRTLPNPIYKEREYNYCYDPTGTGLGGHFTSIREIVG